MKRTIACPACDVKLAIFDMGKPIKQKCPKCGHGFIIENGQAKSEAEASDKAAAETGKTAGSAKPEAESGKKTAEQPKAADSQVKPEAESGKKDAEQPKAADSSDKQADKGGDAADAPKKQLKPKSGKRITTGATSELAALESELESGDSHAGGVSMLFKAAVIGLLLLLAVMQVISKRSSDKQYRNVIDHLQYIEKNLGRN